MIARKERNSSIELLRLLAMFLVLVVHADYWTLGAPTQSETLSAPLGSLTRNFFEALSIVCVNVFVLISGWFSIKPSARSFCNFIFQCLFFLVGIYAVALACGLTTFSLKGLAGCFVLTERSWFIKAYIVLYILAPVLNAFVEHTDQKTFKAVLISFFLFQTVYSWATNAAAFFEVGNSTMSFIGLYLLARYVRIYGLKRGEIPPQEHISCCSGASR